MQSFIMAQRVLVVGGSGYLGQFLVTALRENYQVYYTFSTRKLQAVYDDVKAFRVDIATGEGLDDLFSQGPFMAVINCAAISQPAVCEKDPEHARAVNVPTQLLAHIDQQRQRTGVESLFIHISTDQVFDGSRAMWVEDDPCEPVNAYGRSKLDAEAAIRDKWPKHVILRSSIIYGPPAPDPVPRPLFLQFVEKSLSEGTSTSFFNDEFRCPIFVDDIVKIVLHLLGLPQLPPSRLYNMGGPERMSRVEMAEKVADARGYSKAAIISAPSSSVQRPVRSPADISMSVERLVRELGLVLTPFSEALQLIPPAAS